MPRDYTFQPDAFGKGPGLNWKKPANEREESYVRAAQLQHLYAVRIKGRIKAEGTNMSTYAVAAGVGYSRISRMLRGEVIMRLEDIAMADIILGEVSEQARASAEKRRAQIKAEEDQRRERDETTSPSEPQGPKPRFTLDDVKALAQKGRPKGRS